MEAERVVSIAPGEPDAQKAQRYRERTVKLLDQIMAVMTEAKRDGLTVDFEIGMPDAFGRFSVTSLEVSKKLA